MLIARELEIFLSYILTALLTYFFGNAHPISIPISQGETDILNLRLLEKMYVKHKELVFLCPHFEKVTEMVDLGILGRPPALSGQVALVMGGYLF